MFKYIALIFVLLLSACAGPDSEPVDLTGSWETVEDAPMTMLASVSGGNLEIVWVDGASSALYWLGTVPDTVTSGDIFVSEGDTAVMDNSLMGSMDDTKEFTYADGTIAFDLTVMGVTQTLYLERL